MPTTTRGFRYPVLSDTANVPRDVGNLAADAETWLARTRVITGNVTATAVGAGAAIAIMGIAAQPLGARLFVSFIGRAGFQATGAAILINLGTSAGSATWPSSPIQATAAQWSALSVAGQIDIAASTGTTLTFSNGSAQSTWFEGQFRIEIRHVGEY